MGEIKSLQSIDIAELKPYEKNSKVHKKEQIEKIQKSIKRFGFLTPVLIDKDKNIIAGHGRLEKCLDMIYNFLEEEAPDRDCPKAPQAEEAETNRAEWTLSQVWPQQQLKPCLRISVSPPE